VHCSSLCFTQEVGCTTRAPRDWLVLTLGRMVPAEGADQGGTSAHQPHKWSSERDVGMSSSISLSPRDRVMKGRSLRPLPSSPRRDLSFRPLPTDLAEWIDAASKGQPYVPTREATMAAKSAQLPSRRRSATDLPTERARWRERGSSNLPSPQESLSSISIFREDDANNVSIAETAKKRTRPEVDMPCTIAVENHVGMINCVAMSGDGKAVVTGSSGGSMNVICASTGRATGVLRVSATESITAVAVNRDGTMAACGTLDGAVRFWHVRTGKELWTVRGHIKPVTDVSISGDCNMVASSSADRTVRVLDGASGAERYALKGHSKWVNSVAFSRGDGAGGGSSKLASAGTDRRICIWNPALGELLKTLRGHTDVVKSVCFGKGGALLASGSYDMTVRVWDVGLGTTLSILRGHTDWITGVSLSEDAGLVASSSYDGSVKVWDVVGCESIGSSAHHNDRVLGVALDETASKLSSVGDDQMVRLYDTSCCMALDGQGKSPPASLSTPLKLDLGPSPPG
jgi:WD40 repeat protein